MAIDRRKLRESIKREEKLLISKVSKFKKFKLKYLNLYLFVISLICWIIFLVQETFIRTWNLYEVFSWVDVPSHFFGGMAVASLVVWLLYFTKGKNENSYVLISVSIASMMWEAMENISDFVMPPANLLMRNVFFWDGIGDIIVTTVGGYVFLWLFDNYIKIKLKRHIYKNFKEFH